MNRPLCPILTIGFPPPEKGAKDIRRCNVECALYDVEQDTCAINALLESQRMLQMVLEDHIYGYAEGTIIDADV